MLEGDPERHSIPGLAEALAGADVVVLSIRRQALPAEDLAALRAHLQAGKPLLGIRTSCHAFDARGTGPADHAQWTGFDPEVLGGNYHGHHGDGPMTTVTRAAADGHPILRGIAGGFHRRRFAVRGFAFGQLDPSAADGPNPRSASRTGGLGQHLRPPPSQGLLHLAGTQG